MAGAERRDYDGNSEADREGCGARKACAVKRVGSRSAGCVHDNRPSPMQGGSRPP